MPAPDKEYTLEQNTTTPSEFEYGLEGAKKTFNTDQFIKDVTDGKFVIMSSKDYTENNQKLHAVYDIVKAAETSKPGTWDNLQSLADGEEIEEEKAKANNNNEEKAEEENMSEENKELHEKIDKLTEQLGSITKSNRDKELLDLSKQIEKKCTEDPLLDYDTVINLMATGKAKTIEEAAEQCKGKIQGILDKLKEGKEEESNKEKEKEEEEKKKVDLLSGGDSEIASTKKEEDKEDIKIDVLDENAVELNAKKILQNIQNKE